MPDTTTTQFPPSTSVSVYPAAKTQAWKRQRTTPPFTATASATTDAAGLTTFSALAVGIYTAVGTVGSAPKFVTVVSHA